MHKHNGFTIVELVVIIVVLGILAALATFGINKYLEDSRDSHREASVTTIATALEKYYQEHGEYPGCDALTGSADSVTGSVLKGLDASALVAPGADTGTDNSIRCGEDLDTATDDFYEYTGDGTPGCNGSGTCATFTLKYRNVGDDAVIEVKATRAVSTHIQTITAANCPSTRTRAVDARDNNTYWVQELADGKCWMLTNLAYAGGGTSTYSDTKTLTNGTGGSPTFTVASYYVPTTGSNVTTEPTAPSTSTDGTGQYGYLYNWCAAMGAQTATSACANATTPAPNTTISVCPAGWRLPTGGVGGEFSTLHEQINDGWSNTDIGFRTNWLIQRPGAWYSGFFTTGNSYYWSSTQYSASIAASLVADETSVNAESTSITKNYGMAVRCMAV